MSADSADELIQAQATEIRKLREQVAELQAREDARGDYRVHIVPGEQHLAECLAHLQASSDVRDGDRLRVAGTGREFVRQGGIWTDA